jgi:hypothetical protein
VTAEKSSEFAKLRSQPSAQRDEKWLMELLACTRLEQLLLEDVTVAGALSAEALRREHTRGWTQVTPLLPVIVLAPL